MQVQDHSAVCVIITGSKGNGKTTLQEKLVRQAKAKRTFIYDHKDGDFARRFKIKPCYDLEELVEAFERGEKIIIFNPNKLFPGDKKKGFDFFTQFVWGVRGVKGIINLVADEFQSVCDQHTFPPGFAQIITEGRTFQIDCYFAAATIDKLNGIFRDQITEVFAFRHGDEGNCDWLEAQGIKAKDVLNLKNGEYIYKDIAAGRIARGGKAFTPKNSARDLSKL